MTHRYLLPLLLLVVAGPALAQTDDATTKGLFLIGNRNEVRGSVNGEPITQFEIDRESAPVFKELEAKYEGIELRQKKREAEQRVLRDRVERLLLLQAARRALSEDQVKRIEYTVDTFIKNRIQELGTLLRLNRELEKEGMTVQLLREQETEDRIIREFQADHISRRIRVTPQAIRTYYDEKVDEFTSPPKLDVRLILLSSMKYKDPAQALAKAQELRRQATGDKPFDFGELARKWSQGPNAADGGLYRDLKLPHFEEEVDQAIKGLKQGDISQPVQTVVGTYLAKVEVRRPSRVAPLEEVQDHIRATLIQQQSLKLRQAYVAELFKDAVIEPETLLR